MWDSNAPLQLLHSMPRKLTTENLEKLQLVIDADKYKNSLVSGFDLCGMYAPFCRGCQKTSIYPCAIAYVNMMRANGLDVEIDAKPVSAEPVAEENLPVEPVIDEVVEETEEVPVEEEIIPPPEEVIEERAEVPAVQKKRKIRIAVARRKF